MHLDDVVMDAAWLWRLEACWFAGRVVPKWETSGSGVNNLCFLELSGYAPLEDSIGPRNVSACAHEMGHLIEIDDRRILHPDFGLYYKHKVFLRATRYSSGIYSEPRTYQGVDRELRVIAIASRIIEDLGWHADEVESDMAYVVGALHVAMPDWYLVPGNTTTARTKWCMKRLERYRRKWTLPMVRAEWERKVVLANRLLKVRARKMRRTLAASAAEERAA